MIRKHLQRAEALHQSVNIIAKIENMQGVQNIDEILRVSDGIMVARGDMGVEIPLGRGARASKRCSFRSAYASGKQVITATQMLDSMMKNPRPTRAETADVANAIYDGTSAIMLSGRDRRGPCIRWKPCRPWRASPCAPRPAYQLPQAASSERDTASHARCDQRHLATPPCTSAHDLGAAAILTVTKGGRHRAHDLQVPPQLHHHLLHHRRNRVPSAQSLSWGVMPLMIERGQQHRRFVRARRGQRRRGRWA